MPVVSEKHMYLHIDGTPGKCLYNKMITVIYSLFNTKILDFV